MMTDNSAESHLLLMQLTGGTGVFPERVLALFQELDVDSEPKEGLGEGEGEKGTTGGFDGNIGPRDAASQQDTSQPGGPGGYSINGHPTLQLGSLENGNGAWIGGLNRASPIRPGHAKRRRSDGENDFGGMKRARYGNATLGNFKNNNNTEGPYVMGMIPFTASSDTTHDTAASPSLDASSASNRTEPLQQSQALGDQTLSSDTSTPDLSVASTTTRALGLDAAALFPVSTGAFKASAPTDNYLGRSPGDSVSELSGTSSAESSGSDEDNGYIDNTYHQEHLPLNVPAFGDFPLNLGSNASSTSLMPSGSSSNGSYESLNPNGEHANSRNAAHPSSSRTDAAGITNPSPAMSHPTLETMLRPFLLEAASNEKTSTIDTNQHNAFSAVMNTLLDQLRTPSGSRVVTNGMCNAPGAASLSNAQFSSTSSDHPESIGGHYAPDRAVGASPTESSAGGDNVKSAADLQSLQSAQLFNSGAQVSDPSDCHSHIALIDEWLNSFNRSDSVNGPKSTKAPRVRPKDKVFILKPPTSVEHLLDSADPEKQRVVEAKRANYTRLSDKDEIICLWVGEGEARPCHRKLEGTNAFVEHCAADHGVSKNKTIKDPTVCRWADCSMPTQVGNLMRHLKEDVFHGRRER